MSCYQANNVTGLETLDAQTCETYDGLVNGRGRLRQSLLLVSCLVSTRPFEALCISAILSALYIACNGLGEVIGSFIVRQSEAPSYVTAVWTPIGYDIMASMSSAAHAF